MKISVMSSAKNMSGCVTKIIYPKHTGKVTIAKEWQFYYLTNEKISYIMITYVMHKDKR